MTPIAAYYVMLAADLDFAARTPRYDAIVPRRSLLERFTEALGILVRLGRPASTQPI